MRLRRFLQTSRLLINIVLVACCFLELGGTFGADVICQHTPNLTETQRQICTEVSQVMVVMNEVMEIFRDECSWQFKTSRWNCTQATPPVYVNTDLDEGPEAAFVYALTSAITVQRIAAACYEHRLGNYCSFDNSRLGESSPEGWTWGMNYDILQGTLFAQRFLDSREIIDLSDPDTSVRAATHLHNNAAGRRVVYDNRRLRCVCHGVSGSCSVKTCTTVIPTIFDLGDILKAKYEEAIRVEVRVQNGEISFRTSAERQGEEAEEPPATELIFVASSTDHCQTDPEYTLSRLCLPRSNLTTLLEQFYPSCEDFCCSGKYQSTTKTYRHSCNCYFVFCCNLMCETCEETYVEYICTSTNT